MMKPLLILILGCMPLAGLTVWSFVELARAKPPIAGPAVAGDWEATAADAANALAAARADAPAVKDLIDADFFAAAPLADLDATPETSRLRGAADGWPRWTRARQMIGKVVLAEEMAAGKDLEQLKEAAEQFGGLRDKYGKLPPRGAASLLEILERRQTAVQAKIARREKEIAGELKVQQARAAFQPTHYGECVALCDELLTGYADTVDISILAKVRVLRDRAQFAADTEKLAAVLRTAGAEERLLALREFSDKYPDREARTDSERRTLEKYVAELSRLEETAALEERGQAADKEISDFEAAAPEGAVARFAAAAQLLAKYPTAAVKSRLRGSARRWIAAALPEKTFDEPLEMREMESKRGELIRGYIREARSSDGAVIGYKRFSTLEQYRDPAAEVGTYRREDLKRGPSETTPRQCVIRYNTARNRLIESPAERENWTSLADLCAALEAALAEYRNRPGAGSAELSFAADEKTARKIAEDAAWENLRKIFSE